MSREQKIAAVEAYLFYLRRGITAGLTRDQIAEAFTHLGFYAGWPKVSKALIATTKALGPAAPR